MSRHTGAPCVYWWPPCFVCACGGLAGAVSWLSRRVHYWRRYYRVGGVSTYASIPTRPRGGGGIAPPPCLPCQYVKKRVPLGLRPLHRARRVAVSWRGVICARAGYRAPPCWCWTAQRSKHGQTLRAIYRRANRRYIPPALASGGRPCQPTTPTPQRQAARPCRPLRLAYICGRPCFPCLSF